MIQPDPTPLAPGLYVAATPIGHLRDVTLRVLDALAGCDSILAEDTRKTAILLQRYEIHKPLKSFRVHRLREDTEHAISELQDGRSLVFVTDAGTPGISDPVSHLVREVRRRIPDCSVIPLPGASALTTALSVCGWQTNPALFGGFLSPKSGRRRTALQQLRAFPGVIVLYESVHRIDRLIADVQEILPGREILVARELTKVHEELVLIPVGADVPAFTRKGEFTLLIGPEGHAGREGGGED